MLPTSLKTTLTHVLSDRTGKPVTIVKISSVGGGCINECYRVGTSAGVYFVKHNDPGRFPGMFNAEARGLKLLREHIESVYNQLLVPEVVAHGTDDHTSYLILEFLEAGQMQGDFWDCFGRGLAQLHKQSDRYFGLDHPNYIGSLPQSNTQHTDWIEFFITERIEAQLRIARDGGRASRELMKSFQDLYPHLPDIFPDEPPALLHGDLWSGNYMIGPGGIATIVDPAVYFGHRYMDLGMSKLFGGFAPAFYESYDTEYPMEGNWNESVEVANLYPLMVHLNLFGGGYLGSIESTLRRFRK
jgi:protein-ribulosamine 3-kinase